MHTVHSYSYSETSYSGLERCQLELSYEKISWVHTLTRWVCIFFGKLVLFGFVTSFFWCGFNATKEF